MRRTSHTQSSIPCRSRSYIYWYFKRFQLKQVTKSWLIVFIWEFWRQSTKCLFTLGSENGENLLQTVWYNGMTHISVLVGWGSNPGVHVVDVTSWANDQGGTSVNDGLAATRAGHGLSIDGNTVSRNSRRWIIVTSWEALCNLCLWSVCVFFVPVHFDLPVGFRGQRDPGDLSSVVVAINTAEDDLTALLTVAKRVKKTKTNVIREFNVTGNDTHTLNQQISILFQYPLR